jgi:DNA invertase Pin-like site-specific DNA recombinase
MTASPLRASLYVRLSDAADADNTSLAGMTADLRREVEKRGFAEVALHVDDGLSGAIRNRPGFLAWLADGREGRADVLMTWSGDRVSREGANALAALLDVIEGKDATTGKEVRKPVRFLDLQGLDSEHGDAFRVVMLVKGEGARMERNASVTRNKARRRRLAEAGRWAGGTPPFGTRTAPNPSGEGLVLVADETEAALLLACAERLFSGESASSVARWLTSQAKPRRAAEWSRVTLRQALTSQAVAGTGGRDGLVFPADYAARLREHLSAPATGRYGDPQRRPSTTPRKGSRLLSGLVVCGTCGATMRVSTHQRGTAYRCPAKSDGRTCAASSVISASALEAYLSGLLETGGAYLPLTERRAVIVGGNADERGAAEAVLKAAREAWEADDTEETLATYRAARDALQALPEVATEVHYETVPLGITLAEKWQAADAAERRAILVASGLTVRILPSTGPRGSAGIDPARVEVVFPETA